MNWNLQTELPLWLVPIGLALAVLLSWLSYNSIKARQLFPPWARMVLIGLRSLTLLIIFILFLGPKIISRVSTKVKPLFLIAVDNSSSMSYADSAGDSSMDIQTRLSKLRPILEDKFDVRTYLFGDKFSESVNPDFSDKATDFGILFENLAKIHHSDPVNGVMIFSDGIYNQGPSPLIADRIFPFMVHTVAYGDSTREPDLRINEVTANDLVYKDTRFPVELLFESYNLSDRQPRVTVSSGNKVLLDTIAEFFPKENTGILRFYLDAESAGIQNYRIRIAGSDVEKNLQNNSSGFTIEVVEHKARILILYGSPHPDISAISSAISEMNQYELQTSDISEFKGKFEDYNLVIFHQLPVGNNTTQRQLFQSFKQSGVPGWFIIGGQTNLTFLNQQDLGITIGDNSGNMADIEPAVNKTFSLFKVDEMLSAGMKDWPPLKGPLSSVRKTSRTEVLFQQRIKTIELDQPLLCFTKSRGGKNAFLLGEGIWRWRLADYLENADNSQVNSLINSIVQYLVIEDDREQFRIQVPGSLTETEKLKVRSQVYNESLEDLPGMIVDFKIIDSLGQISSYEMRPSYSGYSLVLDPLKPGKYTYKAETNVGQNNFSKQGQFLVQDVNLEDLVTAADFRILEQMANQKGGQFFLGNQTEELNLFADKLEPGVESERIESKWLDLMALKYFVFFIVFLLTLEWLLRRWFGTR